MNFGLRLDAVKKLRTPEPRGLAPCVDGIEPKSAYCSSRCK